MNVHFYPTFGVRSDPGTVDGGGVGQGTPHFIRYRDTANAGRKGQYVLQGLVELEAIGSQIRRSSRVKMKLF